MPRIVRRPLHAGTWYETEPGLSSGLETWLAAADTGNTHARAIISPHAGLRYCGHVMAHAYKHIDPQRVSRVFVVGPSHHIYTRQCLLSVANAYSAPQGQVEIDQDIYSHLLRTGHFERMRLETDEAEHSLELQMPFIMHIMRGQPFKLVPIMVGAISPDREALYGRLLGPFLDDPQNLFIVSSDFCHWGQRFGFTYHDIPKHGSISKSIQWLDQLAMDVIEQGRPEAFTAYLEQYGNTICGRHPIGVLLNMLQHTQVGHVIRFQKYDQSAQCQSIRESSVSYAAAVMTVV
ncbi:hypothetical protein WJX77_001024 [Trebouxia sp. C0004]